MTADVPAPDAMDVDNPEPSGKSSGEGEAGPEPAASDGQNLVDTMRQLEDDPSWVAAYGNYPLQRGRGIARFALGTLQLEVQVEDYRLTREEKEGLTVEKLDILPILNVPWFDRRVVCYDAAFDPMQHADVVEVRVYIHAAHGLVTSAQDSLQSWLSISLNGRECFKRAHLIHEIADDNCVKTGMNPQFYKVFLLDAFLPGLEMLTIQLRRKSAFQNAANDLIAETRVALADRFFNDHWNGTKEHHVEFRNLFRSPSQVPVGLLECSIDMVYKKEAHRYPFRLLKKLEPSRWELRVVVWGTYVLATHFLRGTNCVVHSPLTPS